MSPPTSHAVLFIMFDRPRHAKESFAAIRAARPPRLYLAADGARHHVPGEIDRCTETIRAVESQLDWPCEVFRLYLPHNVGSALAISRAITWALQKEEAITIFEEDCVAGPAFFAFVDAMLERYADDPTVGMVSGCQFVIGGWRPPEGASYSFTRLAQIWGWATWRRAWQHYDHAMNAWPAAREENWLRTLFPRRADQVYWRSRFDMVHANPAEVWDYRWAFARWHHNLWGIVPARNLVTNTGFAPDARHTRDPHHPCANLPRGELPHPLQHPRVKRHDRRLDRRTRDLLFSEGTRWTYHRDRWKKRLRAWKILP